VQASSLSSIDGRTKVLAVPWNLWTALRLEPAPESEKAVTVASCPARAAIVAWPSSVEAYWTACVASTLQMESAEDRDIWNLARHTSTRYCRNYDIVDQKPRYWVCMILQKLLYRVRYCRNYDIIGQDYDMHIQLYRSSYDIGINICIEYGRARHPALQAVRRCTGHGLQCT
jgi:hypothetical protein